MEAALILRSIDSLRVVESPISHQGEGTNNNFMTVPESADPIPSQRTLLFFEAALGRICSTRIYVNNKNSRVANLVFYTIVFHKEYTDTRKVGEPSYLGHRCKQKNLLMNHAKQLAAICVATIALIKIGQDGFKIVRKLRTVKDF